MNPKICYFDLNSQGFCEVYNYNAKKYGGARIFAAVAKDKIPNFHIYSKSQSFEDLEGWENKSACHTVSQEQLDKIMNGELVSEVIPECSDSNLYVHHNAGISLNLKGCKTNKEVVWPIGWAEKVNPNIPYLLFFDFKGQQPQLSHINHKIFDVVIGPPVPEFQEYDKQDYIFTCGRQSAVYQSIQAAQLALKHGIKTIFAGPIDSGYNDFLNYIDNKTTFYLGQISQEEKIKHNKLAKFSTQFQNYPISVTLSAKEALSFGTAILATNVGGWKDFIKNGINGFIINNEQDYINAWNNRNLISQRNCYDSVLFTSEEKMIESFSKVFKEIHNDTSI